MKLLPIIALLCAFGLSACQDEAKPDPRTQPPKVLTATATTAQDDSRDFTGVVSAKVESNLGFRVSGKVVERLVDTGQTVKKGQVLMRLDVSDLKLQFTAQEQAVKSAQAVVTQTSNDELRYRDLLGIGAVSRSAYDQIVSAKQSAQANLQSAQAQLKTAQNALSYATLTADSSGVITETLAEVGQVVGAGQTVVRLAQAGQREAMISLPENFRPPLGTQAVATLYGDNRRDVAILRQLSGSADAITRTYQARFALQGELANAPLGATVSIRLDEQDDNDPTINALQIPIGAVLDTGKGTGVWAVQAVNGEHRTIWRAVTVHKLGKEWAWVSGELQAGESVVALGVHLLQNNQIIQPLANAQTSQTPNAQSKNPSEQGADQ